MELMERYPWPGNVRELENVLERAVLLSKGAFIEVEDLPAGLVTQSQVSLPQPSYGQMGLKEALEGPEKAIIRTALEANSWNRQETAKALQINRTTLYKKMKRLGLEDEAERLGL
jgi:DNA-binding NtrC family response regulator